MLNAACVIHITYLLIVVQSMKPLTPPTATRVYYRAAAAAAASDVQQMVVTVSVCSSVWISIIGGKSHRRGVYPILYTCVRPSRQARTAFDVRRRCKFPVNRGDYMRANLYAFRAILLNKMKNTMRVCATLTRCAGFRRGISLCPKHTRSRRSRRRRRRCPVVYFQNNRITAAAFDRLKVFADICRMAHIQY